MICDTNFLIISVFLISLIESSPNRKSDKNPDFTKQDGLKDPVIDFTKFDDLDVENIDDDQKSVRSIFLSFDRALEKLQPNLEKMSGIYSYVFISVHKSNIVDESFDILKIHKKNFPMLRYKVRVEFLDDIDVDVGGLLTEWFSLFSAEVFNPEYGLFKYSDKISSTIEINPKSGNRHADHLLKFELLGMVTALAIRNKRLIQATFIVPFLKTMLHRPISLNDVRLTDPAYHKSLLWTKDNDVSKLDHKFTFIAHESTATNVIPLMKNGQNITVTENNKIKFIRLLINWRYIRRVEKQMSAFLKGFELVMPLKSLQVFTADELQLVIAGQIKIDLKFWKRCTKYYGYSSFSKQIGWFWQAVESFDVEKRSRLISFVTGTPRFATDGKRRFKFEIINKGDITKLPGARTCFNQLRLPPYENYEDLLHNLDIVTKYPAGYKGKNSRDD